jgi:hypothetical protein
VNFFNREQHFPDFCAGNVLLRSVLGELTGPVPRGVFCPAEGNDAFFAMQRERIPRKKRNMLIIFVSERPQRGFAAGKWRIAQNYEEERRS